MRESSRVSNQNQYKRVRVDSVAITHCFAEDGKYIYAGFAKIFTFREIHQNRSTLSYQVAMVLSTSLKFKEAFMKKLLFFFIVSLLLPLGSVFPQTLSDYISAVKGDTLVIKDYYDMDNQPNSLNYAMLLDSVDVPAGRVYELKANGYYPLASNPTTLRNTVIVGEDNRILVNNNDAGSAPPLICGSGGNSGGIHAAHNLTIKDCNITPAASNSILGWLFLWAPYAPYANVNITADNCLFERTRYVFVRTDTAHCNITLRNCYFVNMSGQACRRSGGVFDSFAKMDTLLVENCTHIMATGSLYRFRYYPKNYQFKRVIFNHNTFINCAGYVFMHPGYQSNMSLTNNIFINSNVQSYPAIHSIDMYEQDPDWLPMGLVNVYPDSTDVGDVKNKKFLCQNNLAYWDPSLANMDSILNANHVNGVTNWQSQMIIMNSRTDSMFDDDSHYPYLVSGTWKNQMPAFTDPQDLFTTQLVNLKAFALGTVDTQSTDILPTWRLINTGPDKYLHSDWLIPVDLSYSDTDLLTGGINGFPIGDLNWFPTQKAAWLAQRTAEYESIDDALNAGMLVTAVREPLNLPAEFQLQQNYPNPFNPSTAISYQLSAVSDVALKVYDVLGREVATLVNEKQYAGTHLVHFEDSSLASGGYFYRLTVNGYKATKKMVLMR